jgi:hypothetical protein
LRKRDSMSYAEPSLQIKLPCRPGDEEAANKEQSNGNGEWQMKDDTFRDSLSHVAALSASKKLQSSSSASKAPAGAGRNVMAKSAAGIAKKSLKRHYQSKAEGRTAAASGCPSRKVQEYFNDAQRKVLTSHLLYDRTRKKTAADYSAIARKVDGLVSVSSKVGQNK